MSRAARLLELLEYLRRHKYPVAGATLAAEFNISLRTLYRDIASLQAQGAQVEGEPGLGYVLRPGFTLPPLMFSEEEIEAIALGTRWVAQRTDSALAQSATNALAKISAVLPTNLAEKLDTSPLIIGPYSEKVFDNQDLSVIRKAIRSEKKLRISYRDVKENGTERTIWPFAIGFFEYIQIIVAWCELRQGFRHFRADRVIEISSLEERYPLRRHALLKKWRMTHEKK